MIRNYSKVCWIEFSQIVWPQMEKGAITDHKVQRKKKQRRINWLQIQNFHIYNKVYILYGLTWSDVISYLYILEDIWYLILLRDFYTVFCIVLPAKNSQELGCEIKIESIVRSRIILSRLCEGIKIYFIKMSSCFWGWIRCLLHAFHVV